MTEYDDELSIYNTFSNTVGDSKHVQTGQLKVCQVLFLMRLEIKHALLSSVSSY
jgi:hypothetical protein